MESFAHILNFEFYCPYYTFKKVLNGAKILIDISAALNKLILPLHKQRGAAR